MLSMGKRIQISNLARACKKAFLKNQGLWISDVGFVQTVFDFPDYGGLPKRISDRLSGDCVDVIQEYVFGVAVDGDHRFSKVALEKLLLDYHKHGYAIP